MKFKNEIYPFTTEMISGYFPKLKLEGKSVLTVGSSLDQAFNALVLGATDVTVYDINPNTEKFYQKKKELILSKPRDELYEAVLGTYELPFIKNEIFGKSSVKRMNCYLESDFAYELLKSRLVKDDISFVSGSIFEMNLSHDDKKYDRIIFSNVLQYIDQFYKGYDISSFIIDNFSKWEERLNDDGVLQLLYLYSYDRHNIEKNASKVISTLCMTKSLDIEEFADNYGKLNDAIVTYTKR